MSEVAPYSPSLPVLEQAALWFQKLAEDSPSEETIAQFGVWRDADRRNAEAFAEIEAAHGFTKSVADSIEMLALRHETLARLVVVEQPRRKWLSAGGLVAACLLILVGLSYLQITHLPWAPFNNSAQMQARTYETGAGQRLAITLPDGSNVTLNTRSRLRLAYDDAERRVVLESGEALFSVAKGQTRPFRVLAGDSLVTAQGTTFDVRLDPDALKVALVEGAVTVSATAGKPEQVVRLQPNDVLVASKAGVRVSRDQSLASLTSWTDGLIIFDNDTLADAVSEMNRYLDRRILLKDDRLKALQISGAFRTGEAETFVEALEISFPIVTVEQSDSRIVLASRK